VASFRTQSDAELEVETAISGPLPPVRADRPAILQVLLNLLHNACHHALGATRVVVGASLDGGQGRVRLTVADDGQGIPRKDQPRIFEPFFSTTGSTGLGLAIAHRLVREHGGRLSVSSTPGEGAVFTVELAVADEKPPSSRRGTGEPKADD
jgi:signal transduction histidine kinase